MTATYSGLTNQLVRAGNGIDYAHGFLFQHGAQFAADVEAFLGSPT
jgi:hypothetical protein